MTIITDTGFDYVNKRIYHAANSEVFDVNVLYSHIQDEMDDLTQLDDDVPMSAATPTSYTMINGWYIEEAFTQFLSGGAIQTVGYTGEIRTLICGSSGWINFVAGDIGNLLTGSVTADTCTLLDYDNTNYKLFVRMTGAGDLLDNATENYTHAGTGTATATAVSTTGETIFANPYTLGSIGTDNGAPQLYIVQDGVKLPNASWFSTGHFDVLVKVRETGVDIDTRQVTVFDRNWNDTYTHFKITLTTAGQNAVPLGNADDLNSTDTEANVDDLTDGTTATIAVAYQFSSPFSYDIGDGDGVQNYDCEIDCNSQTLDQVYEVLKYWTREGSTKQLEVGADATFIDGEQYVGADAAYTEVSASPFGTFAGGKMFGAQGVHFINLDSGDIQNFQLVDNAGITRFPPNFQSFAVSGLNASDNVAVYESTGASSVIVDKSQFGLSASNPTNVIRVTETILTSTPTAGTIIVVDLDGTETVYAYSAWTNTGNSDFTVTATASTHAATATAYVPYIYQVAGGAIVSEGTTIYTGNLNVVAVVRQSSFIPRAEAGTYGTTGYAASIPLTADSIYT